MNKINIVLAVLVFSNVTEAIFYQNSFSVIQKITLGLNLITLAIWGYVFFRQKRSKA